MCSQERTCARKDAWCRPHTGWPITAIELLEGSLVEENRQRSPWPARSTCIVIIPQYCLVIPKKKERKVVHTFADDAASNAFDASPEATSLITKPRAPHARTRLRTQNAPTFCDRSHSLIVQMETTRRAFENTIS